MKNAIQARAVREAPAATGVLAPAGRFSWGAGPPNSGEGTVSAMAGCAAVVMVSPVVGLGGKGLAVDGAGLDHVALRAAQRRAGPAASTASPGCSCSAA